MAAQDASECGDAAFVIFAPDILRHQGFTQKGDLNKKANLF
jgi:hypothetical protein